MKIIVTGGMGFIGSNFINYLLENNKSYEIINIDSLTYAANPKNTEALNNNSHYSFIKGDIGDLSLINSAVDSAIDCIVNFAAESHVDRSISQPSIFLETNVLGTQVLLEAVRNNKHIKLIQISTDEVYGSTLSEFTEESIICPSSPYSASKAAADLLVGAYLHTYNIDANIVRCTNNFGPMQFPEKLIPVTIFKGINNLKIPLYGSGEQEREWIYVRDFCRAIETVMLRGRKGSIYNIGSGIRKKNAEIIKFILDEIGADHSLINPVEDRLGHDFRYAVNHNKIKNELGWEPIYNFEEALRYTIRWYVDNQKWWEEKA